MIFGDAERDAGFAKGRVEGVAEGQTTDVRRHFFYCKVLEASKRTFGPIEGKRIWMC